MGEVFRLMREEDMSKDEAYDTVAEERQRREIEYRELQTKSYERGSEST